MPSFWELDQFLVESTKRYPSGSWTVTPQVSQYGLCAGTRLPPCCSSLLGCVRVGLLAPALTAARLLDGDDVEERIMAVVAGFFPLPDLDMP